jgi:hypothetical protein
MVDNDKNGKMHTHNANNTMFTLFLLLPVRKSNF